MTAQTPSIYDFVAETKGHCFLCSKNISFRTSCPTNVESDSLTSKSSSIHSLHCLSRYLKVDMKKVFTGNGPIPPHLIDRVEKSRLKAELCEGCAVLTGNFSKLFRQLEKTEMEITSCLNLLHRKLERAEKLSDKVDGFSEWLAKLEITEALRKDTKEKCSRKLRNILPLSKLQRLTLKQIDAKKRKIKQRKSVPRPTQYSDSNYEDCDAIASPASDPEMMPDEDGSDYFDEPSLHSTPMPEESHILGLGMETVKQEVIEGTSVPDMKTKGSKPSKSTKLHQQKFQMAKKNIEADQITQ